LDAGAHRAAASDNLADRCRTFLPSSLQRLLQAAAETGDAAGVRVFAVGGFVRDLLLGVRDADLDLTVEGDGVAFARRLGAAIGGVSKGPSAFGTVVVVAPGGQKIDVATARRETYTHPAALPTVTPGTIRDDLWRRDFSINTLAFPLHGPGAFTLLDWYGGRADLSAGIIRVLHDASFRDDPTRIFRAIRLEQRFGFTLQAHTGCLLRRAVEQRWIERLSGARLWRELRLMLESESAGRCLARLQALEALSQVDAALRLGAEGLAVLTGATAARADLTAVAPEVGTRPWFACLAALLSGLTPEEIRRICRRLALSARVTQSLSAGLAAVE